MEDSNVTLSQTFRSLAGFLQNKTI